MTQDRYDPKTAKYLRTRATTSPWQLAGCLGQGFRAVIVIPALAEADSLPECLLSLEHNPPESLSQTLVIVVVNNRLRVESGQKAQNQRTLLWLEERTCAQLNLCWVDASSAGLELPEKDGVGLARKVGFDLALARLDWGSHPVLISLDADSLVDANYLPTLFAHFASHTSGATYLPFRHQPGATPAQEAAIRDYELYLRAYQFGLNWAGSPYAFISIGSALGCRASAYVAAGGMPRRQAGEDFYFLQQLVKTAGVSPLAGTLVRPAARYSARVPFGTGRTLEARVEQDKRLYCFISVDSFRILKSWLSAVETLHAEEASTLLEKAARISALLESFLSATDFAAVWQKLHKQATGVQFLRAWHHWFDGLKTRQLLSRLEQAQVGRSSEVLVAELLDAAGYPNRARGCEQLSLLERLQGVV